MKMYKLGRYKQTDRMSDLICENYPMLLVLSRFGISLGFGDKTIGEVCEDSGVDTKTFLTIVNLLLDDHTTAEQIDPSLSVEALVSYLQNSHSYFLDFRLPLIRRKLIEAIDCGHSDVSFAIMRYFDQYVAEVRKHMNYEETTGFPLRPVRSYRENPATENITSASSASSTIRSSRGWPSSRISSSNTIRLPEATSSTACCSTYSPAQRIWLPTTASKTTCSCR